MNGLSVLSFAPRIIALEKTSPYVEINGLIVNTFMDFHLVISFPAMSFGEVGSV